MASSLNWSWRVLTRREHEGKGVPDGLSVGMGEGGNDIEVGREAEEAEAEKGEQVDLFWLEKAPNNKGENLVFLWTLFRDWNTSTPL